MVQLLWLTEWLLALIISGTAIAAHAAFSTNAGGLWRDEANTVNIATKPKFAEMLRDMEFESYPPLWSLCVRGWAALGWGTKDGDLRNLGLLVGLAQLLAIWWLSRSISRSVPLCALAFVALQPAILRYGDTLRAYGLANFLMLASCTLIWQYAAAPSWRRWLLAALVATLSVFCLYYNCFMVLAFCLGGASVAVARREGKTAMCVLSIGGTAAVLLGTLYGGYMRKSSDWIGLVVRDTIDFEWLGRKFLSTLLLAGPNALFLWLLFFLLGIIALCVRFWRPQSETPSEVRARLIYFAVALTVGSVCYALFLRQLGFLTEPWYYLLLITLLGIGLDQLIWEGVKSLVWGRALRVLGALFVLFSTWPMLWYQTELRMTNVDISAQQLNEFARDDDLVLLNPWWLGVPFGRYYHGKAEWQTIPEIADHTCHRYDLVKERMAAVNPLQATLERIDKTLRGGHRVFFIGHSTEAPLDMALPDLPPAPHGPKGWHEEPYLAAWTVQSFAYLRRHALQRGLMPVYARNPVSDYEVMPLWMFEGWREQVAP